MKGLLFYIISRHCFIEHVNFSIQHFLMVFYNQKTHRLLSGNQRIDINFRFKKSYGSIGTVCILCSSYIEVLMCTCNFFSKKMIVKARLLHPIYTGACGSDWMWLNVPAGNMNIKNSLYIQL